MDGKVIYLAARNPSIAIQDWPAAWRSHYEFASQFSELQAEMKGFHYCNRVSEPTLNGAPFHPPGLYRDVEGVAVIAMAPGGSFEGSVKPEIWEAIMADERRVFGRNNTPFHLKCEETFVQGGAPGGAAVIRFLARGKDKTREAFQEYWNGPHAEIAARSIEAAGYVTRYVQNVGRDEPPPTCPYDGISETWFRSVEDAARSLVDADLETLAKDLPAFCDMDRSITLLTEVIHSKAIQ